MRKFGGRVRGSDNVLPGNALLSAWGHAMIAHSAAVGMLSVGSYSTVTFALADADTRKEESSRPGHAPYPAPCGGAADRASREAIL